MNNVSKYGQVRTEEYRGEKKETNILRTEPAEEPPALIGRTSTDLHLDDGIGSFGHAPKKSSGVGVPKGPATTPDSSFHGFCPCPVDSKSQS